MEHVIRCHPIAFVSHRVGSRGPSDKQIQHLSEPKRLHFDSVLCDI